MLVTTGSGRQRISANAGWGCGLRDRPALVPVTILVIRSGLNSAKNRTGRSPPHSSRPDCYEFLQVSKAEFATIQQVYRFLASRYRPDNAVTGDAEKFLLPEHAFEVLPDPAR